MLVRITSLRGPSPRHCGRAAQLQPFEEILQRWRAVNNTVSDLAARDLNLRPPAPETNECLLDRLAVC